MSRRTCCLVLALLANATAFKFLSNFKASSLIPRPSALLKRRRAAQTFGDKKLAVITGASSGVGLATTAELLRTGEYHVFAAVRDVEKMYAAAKDEDVPLDELTALQVDLDSFDSVRAFCKDLEKSKLNKPIDRLICNAATYVPSESPAWSADGHERTMQVNYLSHFLLVSLMLPGMGKAQDPRVIFVGGATAAEDVGVYPRADLNTLDGLRAGFSQPVSMLDGFNYLGAKAYKDSKLSLSMLSHMLHERYHKQTAIAFTTAYLGELGDSAMLEGKPPLESALPLTTVVKALVDFEYSAMKSIGLGSSLLADRLMDERVPVSTAEAGARLFQVAHDGRCSKSGTFWSWSAADAAASALGGDAKEDLQRAKWEAIHENEPSETLTDSELGRELWKGSSQVTGAAWPPAYQPKSPCPTLVVVGAVTKAMNAKEEAKRNLEGLEAGGVGGKVLGGTGYALDAVMGNTIGRAAKIAQDKLLGGQVDLAIQGSYQQTVKTSKGRRTPSMDDEDATAATELDERVAAALDGGLPVPSPEVKAL